MNICICIYMSCVHFYGRDQLVVQYSLLGGTVLLIRKTEVSRTVLVLSESQTSMMWYPQ